MGQRDRQREGTAIGETGRAKKKTEENEEREETGYIFFVYIGVGMGFAPVEIKNFGPKLVPEKYLPKNWTNFEKKGYWAFLQRHIGVYKAGKFGWKKNMTKKQAISDLTELYQKMSLEDRQLFALEYSLKEFTPSFPDYVFNLDDPTTHRWVYRPWGLNRERLRPLPVMPNWTRNFVQWRVNTDYSNKFMTRNGTFATVDVAGGLGDVTLNVRRAKKNSLHAFERWANETEAGKYYRLNPPPEVEDALADRIIRRITKNKKSLYSISEPNRAEAKQVVQKLIQMARADGSGYMAYKLYEGMEIFSRYTERSLTPKF
ncbi:hypothetical protein AAMO2058_000816300 [Amorphochlora amoebiformis]